jgi:hypothetical protein
VVENSEIHFSIFFILCNSSLCYIHFSFLLSCVKAGTFEYFGFVLLANIGIVSILGFNFTIAKRMEVAAYSSSCFSGLTWEYIVFFFIWFGKGRGFEQKNLYLHT